MSTGPKSEFHQNSVKHTDGTSTESDKHEEGILPEPAVQPQVAPPPPPDGGLQAWLAVMGGFLFVLNSWYISYPRERTALIYFQGNGKYVWGFPGLLLNDSAANINTI
jgi:hypothetical protein